MKRLLTLGIIISLPLICSAQTDGCKSKTYERLKDLPKEKPACNIRSALVGNSLRVCTSSDEVYLKLMREFRQEVRSVYMRPNKWGKTGEYTEYIVFFPRQMRFKIEQFIKYRI